MFEPSELEGRNFLGVSNKKPLDPEKLDEIRELVYQYFLAHPSESELVRRDWRKATHLSAFV